MNSDFPQHGTSYNGLNISLRPLHIWYNKFQKNIDISWVMTISASKYLFVTSTQFLSLNGINFSRQGMYSCPVFINCSYTCCSMNKNSRLLNISFLIKISAERSRWNGVGAWFLRAEIKMIYDFAQLYTKSNMCFCFKLSDLFLWAVSLWLSTVMVWVSINVFREKDCSLLEHSSDSTSLLSLSTNSLLVSSFWWWRKISKLGVASDLKWTNDSSANFLYIQICKTLTFHLC